MPRSSGPHTTDLEAQAPGDQIQQEGRSPDEGDLTSVSALSEQTISSSCSAPDHDVSRRLSVLSSFLAHRYVVTEALRGATRRLATVSRSSLTLSHSDSSSSTTSSQGSSESSSSSNNASTAGDHIAHRLFNQGRFSRHSNPSSLGIDGRETTSWWPRIRTTYDPARKLKPDEVWTQRLFVYCLVFMANVACLVAALISKNHTWVFAFIIFVKSKDCIQSIYSAIALVIRSFYRLIFPPRPVEAKWILTLIPAYSESEEQIVKTVFSLRDNDVEPHKQVMCVILDGRHRDVREHMTMVIKSFRCAYTTSKQKSGELSVDVGFMEDVPIIVIEKLQNAGKKDSLILCHDLFNWPRDNMPHYSQLLRAQIWEEILPSLTMIDDFKKFDMIFCTDADSTIFKGAVASLANALARDKDAIASCGVLFVELEPGNEWSIWTLYQMFQVHLPLL